MNVYGDSRDLYVVYRVTGPDAEFVAAFESEILARNCADKTDGQCIVGQAFVNLEWSAE